MSTSVLEVSSTVQSEASDAAPLAIPSRYESAVQVGAGGMGIVYKARDRETGDVVALKILKPDIAADPAMQENLKKEMCLARKVTHKNVCRIHEFNRSGGQVYISMEFVEGKSLLGFLQQNGRLPWNEAVRIGKQVCAGLGEAHAQGIVHRDLKPANVMIDEGGLAKIMDFGIARPTQIKIQMTSTMIGTPAYMAPEQVAGRGVDARTDIYGVGLLLYAMVTSSEAFEGNPPLAVALKQLREFPTPAREVVPGLPAHAEAIIVKCIQKDPAKRFQSMDELAAALTNEPRFRVKAPALSIAKDLQRFGRIAYRVAPFKVKDARQFLKQLDMTFLQNREKQKALAAGLAAICLLGGIVFAVPKNNFESRGPERVSLSGKASLSAEEIKPSAVVGIDRKGSVGLISTRKPNKISPINAVPAKQASSNLKRSTSHNAKSRPMTSDSASTSIAAKVTSAPVETLANSPEIPITAPEATPTSSHVSNKQKIEKTFSGVGTVVRSLVPRRVSADSSFQSKSATESAALSERYLEVGLFKDSKSADDVADKLTKLGFRATSVRKNTLWKQSYQVRVGPYADSTELSTAQQEIASDGFNAHILK